MYLPSDINLTAPL